MALSNKDQHAIVRRILDRLHLTVHDMEQAGTDHNRGKLQQLVAEWEDSLVSEFDSLVWDASFEGVSYEVAAFHILDNTYGLDPTAFRLATRAVLPGRR